MAIVGNLFVNLKANTAAFGKGMDRARTKSKSSMGAITGNLKKIGIAAGLMGAAAVAGFALLIKRSADAADKLGKLSESTGISVEKLSALGFAAEQSGIDMDFVAQRMVNLARRAKEADRGVLSYAIAFKKLGIELRDNDGNLKATDALLLEVADGFAGLEDGTLKAALATDIFSNQGVALIPLLNKGADGIRAMMEEAKELGVVINTETAIAAQEFNDNLNRLSAVVRGLSTQLFAELAPALESGTASLVRFAKESSVTENIVTSIGFAFRTFFSTVALGTAILDTLGITIKRLGADFILSFEGDIEGLRANTEFFAKEIADVWTSSLQSMMEAMGLASTEINKGQKKITDGNKKLLVGLKETEKKLKTLPPIAFFNEADARVQQLTKNWEKLNAEQAKIEAAWAALPPITFLSEGDKQLLRLIDDMEIAREQTAAIEVAAQQMGSSMLAAFDAAIIGGEGFKGILQGLLIDVVRLINRMIFMATVGTAAGSTGFQAGGRTPTNVPILVGERGPELFVPDTAGRIVPNESIGGLTIIVHAEGGDAATEMRVRRGIAEAMKQAVELSRLNIIDRAQRGG